MQFRIGDWVVSPYANLAERAGEARRLESRAVAVLEYLVRNKDRTVSKDELLDAVWQRTAISEHSVTVVISDLRRALGDDSREPRYIQTIPRKGYRLIADAGYIDAANCNAPEEAKPPSVKKRPFWRTGTIAAAVAVIITLAGLAAAFGPDLRRAGSAVPSNAILTPQQFIVTHAGGDASAVRRESFTSLNHREVFPAFSPDNTRVAFSWNEHGGRDFDIYIKQIGTEKLLQVSHSDVNDMAPKWSRDGSHIVFTRLNFLDPDRWCSIVIVPAIGAPEREVTGCGRMKGYYVGADWSQDGRYVVAPLTVTAQDQDDRIAISAIDLETLQPRPLTRPVPHLTNEGMPVLSPDGSTLAFVRVYTNEMVEIVVLEVDKDLKPMGEPRIVARKRIYVTDLDWMPDGRGLIASFSEDGPFGAHFVPLDGGEITQALISLTNLYGVSISSDGRNWIVDQREEAIDLARMKLEPGFTFAANEAELRERMNWVENSTRFEWSPDYSPDQSKMIYISDRTYSGEIWMNDLEGGIRQISNLRNDTIEGLRFSPDGERIAFYMSVEGNMDVFVMPAQGGRAERLTTHDAADRLPEWMPDGKGLYFISERAGRGEVWSLDLETKATRQITKFGVNKMRLASGGQGFYFSRPDDPGIYFQPLNESDETVKLVTRNHIRSDGLWDTNGSAIFYLDRGSNPEGHPALLVYRHDPGSGTTEQVAQMPHAFAPRRVRVNRAGDEIAFSVLTRWAGDLHLLTIGE